MQAISEQELHVAVAVRQSIIDSHVRASEYANRAQVLTGSAPANLSANTTADTMSHIRFTTVGALVPSVRIQVDKVLGPNQGQLVPRCVAVQTAFYHELLPSALPCGVFPCGGARSIRKYSDAKRMTNQVKVVCMSVCV